MAAERVCFFSGKTPPTVITVDVFFCLQEPPPKKKKKTGVDGDYRYCLPKRSNFYSL